MLSKEQGIVAIGVCGAYDVLLHWEMLWCELVEWIRVKRSSTAECKGHESSADVSLKGDNDLVGMAPEEHGKGLNGLVRNHSCLKKGKTNKVPNDKLVKNVTKRLGMLQYTRLIND